MSRKVKVDFKERLLNKTLLAVLVVLFGILAVVGAATHMILGAIFMLFFMAAFGSLISMGKIKQMLDNKCCITVVI